MSRIRDAIPPSETIEWRWPKGGDNAKGVLLGLALIGLAGASLGGAFWSGLVSGDFTEVSSFGLAMVALHLGLPLLVDKVRAVAVTGQRIVLKDGRFPGKIRTVYRELAQYVVHYEGGNLLVLFGRDGELYRGHAQGKADEFLEALDLPVVAWKPRNLSRGAKMLRILPAVFLMGLMVADMVLLVWLATTDWFPNLRETLKPIGWLSLPVVMTPFLLFMFAKFPLSGFLTVAVGRVCLSPEAVSEFLRSWSDPQWMGVSPRVERPGFISSFLHGSARLLGAKLVDLPDHEPELENGATPEMVARAQAAEAVA